MSSDFVIKRFNHLRRLICVHGRYSFWRTTQVVMFSFYKNLAFPLPLFWFCFWSMANGTTSYDSLLIVSHDTHTHAGADEALGCVARWAGFLRSLRVSHCLVLFCLFVCLLLLNCCPDDLQHFFHFSSPLLRRTVRPRRARGDADAVAGRVRRVQARVALHGARLRVHAVDGHVPELRLLLRRPRHVLPSGRRPLGRIRRRHGRHGQHDAHGRGDHHQPHHAAGA